MNDEQRLIIIAMGIGIVTVAPLGALIGWAGGHALIGAAVGAGVGATIGALSQVELNRLVEAGQASRLAQGGQAT